MKASSISVNLPKNSKLSSIPVPHGHGLSQVKIVQQKITALLNLKESFTIRDLKTLNRIKKVGKISNMVKDKSSVTQQ